MKQFFSLVPKFKNEPFLKINFLKYLSNRIINDFVLNLHLFLFLRRTKKTLKNFRLKNKTKTMFNKKTNKTLLWCENECLTFLHLHVLRIRMWTTNREAEVGGDKLVTIDNQTHLNKY